jgi:RNA polymerase sigma factor (sigma-70 family)
VNSSRKFWEKIYQENAPKLIGICRRYVSNNELAEDLVHDAFLTAIDKQSTYSGRGSFEGWLRQIVVNTALMYLRKEKNQKENRNLVEIEEKLLYAEAPEEESISIIEEAQFTDSDLLSAIDCLPFHHKLVFNLYVVDGYTHKQIAQQLNISEGTSKSHLSRARKKIQEILYQRAASKQKKEKTRAAVLIPVIAKAGYIDSLFKTRMDNFGLAPVKDPDIFLSQINWSLQVKPFILKKQILNVTMQITKFVVLPVALSVAVIYSTSVYNSSKEKPINSRQEIQIEPVQTVTADSVENVSIPSKTDTIKHSKQKLIHQIDKKPAVIVKRTIVQKQTVKVQKTVQIYDTTDIR